MDEKSLEATQLKFDLLQSIKDELEQSKYNYAQLSEFKEGGFFNKSKAQALEELSNQELITMKNVQAGKDSFYYHNFTITDQGKEILKEGVKWKLITFIYELVIDTNLCGLNRRIIIKDPDDWRFPILPDKQLDGKYSEMPYYIDEYVLEKKFNFEEAEIKYIQQSLCHWLRDFFDMEQSKLTPQYLLKCSNSTPKKETLDYIDNPFQMQKLPIHIHKSDNINYHDNRTIGIDFSGSTITDANINAKNKQKNIGNHDTSTKNWVLSIFIKMKDLFKLW